MVCSFRCPFDNDPNDTFFSRCVQKNVSFNRIPQIYSNARKYIINIQKRKKNTNTTRTCFSLFPFFLALFFFVLFSQCCVYLFYFFAKIDSLCSKLESVFISLILFLSTWFIFTFFALGEYRLRASIFALEECLFRSPFFLGDSIVYDDVTLSRQWGGKK